MNILAAIVFSWVFLDTADECPAPEANPFVQVIYCVLHRDGFESDLRVMPL